MLGSPVAPRLDEAVAERTLAALEAGARVERALIAGTDLRAARAAGVVRRPRRASSTPTSAAAASRACGWPTSRSSAGTSPTSRRRSSAAARRGHRCPPHRRAVDARHDRGRGLPRLPHRPRHVRRHDVERVTFDGCLLGQADFREALLRAVRFDRCDLSQADLTGVRIDRCELRGCTLDGLVAVERLRGAAMPWDDVVGNAALLAAALGIRVLEGDER